MTTRLIFFILVCCALLPLIGEAQHTSFTIAIRRRRDIPRPDLTVERSPRTRPAPTSPAPDANDTNKHMENRRKQ